MREHSGNACSAAQGLEGESTRRRFLGRTAALTGAALFSPGLLRAAEGARTAVDQVTLGKTGIKLSRLGFGTGSNSGKVQKALGQQAFNDLIRYAYDKGITYFDCAQSYATFEWIGDAIKGLPREKLFIQSKVPGRPADVLKAIDRHRQVFKTDYIDSLLVHCMVKDGWTEQWKRVLEGFNQAQEKKWVRAKGVSCHSLPALRTAAASDWPEVHLVRVNPQAKWIDGPEQTWNKSGDDIAPVLKEIKAMHEKGRGVIGMKLIGNGEFVDAADREKAARFAMAQKEIDAVVIGFKSREEIDEGIERINRALAVQVRAATFMEYTAQPILPAKAILGEGAIWDARSQRLHWIDISGQRVNSFDPATGRNESIDIGCEAGTVAPRRSGGLMLAVRNGFASLDPATGRMQLLAEVDVPGQRFNDGKCDPAGRFWAGTLSYARTPGAAKLYCLEADLTVRTMLENVTTSNGIVWTGDRGTMYYVDTGPREIYAFDYDLATGNIGNQRTIIRPEDGLGKPDGMAIDADDTLWVALWGGGAVAHYDPRSGRMLDLVRAPGAKQTSSCALGGRDLDELYITTGSSKFTEKDWQEQPLAGSLFRVKVKARGVVADEFGG